MQETRVQSLGWEDILEKALQPAPVFLPGEFHGQRCLGGYTLWSHKESDRTERLTLLLSSSLDSIQWFLLTEYLHHARHGTRQLPLLLGEADSPAWVLGL